MALLFLTDWVEVSLDNIFHMTILILTSIGLLPMDKRQPKTHV